MKLLRVVFLMPVVFAVSSHALQAVAQEPDGGAALQPIREPNPTPASKHKYGPLYEPPPLYPPEPVYEPEAIDESEPIGDFGAGSSLPGLEAAPDELEAWRHASARRYIRAREMAEAILRRDNKSFVAHLVLGLVQHYAEANFPRALFHLNRALERYERRYGQTPGPKAPFRWHVALLKALAWVHADLEHFPQQLAYIGRYNELYEPDMVAERAWPLMKMRHYGEARLAAELALATDRGDQREIALNALCAIEFEAGNDEASYRACKGAVDDSWAGGMTASAVDLSNFAEAARSLFKLDEAERISLEATVARLSWYANPWMELAELYLRQARVEEALSALQEIPRYRALRPAHVRESDRNSTRRALAAFLLVVGRPLDAMDVTSRALVAPDRRAHNSRDPLQDRAVVALLHRRAALLAAEMLMEQAPLEPLHKRAWAWLQAWWLRFRAWRAASLAKRLLSDEKRLVGIFQIGSARSAILPSWFVGELIALLGAGVAEGAVRRAAGQDKRPGAKAYYDAFLAEVAAARGDHARALSLATAALAELDRGEALLRARLQATAAEAATRAGRNQLAYENCEAALQTDRGVFRRLGLAIPASIAARGDAVAHETAELLASSPRFEASRVGLHIRIRADRSGGRACLHGHTDTVLGCAEVRAKADEDAERVARRLARRFHLHVFAPRIDLSRTDINSLDGTNIAPRDTLQTVLGSP